jgi:hypothetical protein
MFAAVSEILTGEDKVCNLAKKVLTVKGAGGGAEAAILRTTAGARAGVLPSGLLAPLEIGPPEAKPTPTLLDLGRVVRLLFSCILIVLKVFFDATIAYKKRIYFIRPIPASCLTI